MITVEQAAANENIYTATAETYFAMCQEDAVFATLATDDAESAVVVEIEKQQGLLPEWKKEIVYQGARDAHNG